MTVQYVKKHSEKANLMKIRGAKSKGLKLSMNGMNNQGCQTTEKANLMKIRGAKSRA